jgi:amidase
MSTTLQTGVLSRRALLSGAAGLAAVACAGRDQPAPPGLRTDVLTGLDGLGVAARVRAGDITAAEAAEAAIDRAERLQPQVNFMVTPAYDRARQAAQRPASGPFAGAPTLIKDLSALQGVRLTYGCRAFAQNVATGNSAYVAAMLAAGANPIGKSTTPEFGFTATTEPLITGPTRNPWNLDYSPGGSSGGAAAAVAAGVVPFAHASDGGGSIRIPAAVCGLVGLKSSRGRLIDDPSDVPLEISVDGVVTRTVRDTAAWLAASERTGAGAALAPVGLVTGPSERRLQIGFLIPDATGRAPHPAVAAAVEAAARACESLGHMVSEARSTVPGEAFQEAFTLYWAAGAAQTVQNVMANAPTGTPPDALLEPLTLQLAELWLRQPEGTMERIIGILRSVTQAHRETFSSNHVLITPVLASPPLQIGEIAPTLPFDVGFARVANYAAYTQFQNVAGTPALSLPLGMSPEGLPIGVQFAADVGQERTLLELAYELEVARPWDQRRAALFAG